MRIYHNQLNQNLQQNCQPVWLVFGDEPWQKIDSLKQIKQHAAQLGFSETIQLAADDKFDWHILVDEFQSMSLFASQRIIELELVNGKTSTTGAKALENITNLLNPDILFIIHGVKVDAATTKKKWFTLLEKQGIYLPIYDIENQHLPRWVKQQAQNLQLNIQQDIIPFLVEFFEGNLLALSQELEKLSILFNQQTITLNDIEKIVIKQAKFNPFQLSEVLLSGDLKKCFSMLNSLQQEGANAQQIIWLLHKEFQQLGQMKNAKEQGINLTEIFKQHRIWKKREAPYKHALLNISSDNISIANSRLADVDLLSKTSSEFNPFILLADVCVSLHHGNTTQTFDLNYNDA